MKDTTYFKASLDRHNLVLSWVVAILLIGVSAFPAIFVALIMSLESETTPLFPILFAIPAPLILMVVALFAPRGYMLADEELTVAHHLSAITVPLSSVSEVAIMSLSKVRRTCGAGGFLGSWGQMQSREVGSFRGYLTKSVGFVVITLKGESPIVVTPDDPKGFVAAIEAELDQNIS